jgi:hypothetical protein
MNIDNIPNFDKRLSITKMNSFSQKFAKRWTRDETSARN